MLKKIVEIAGKTIATDIVPIEPKSEKDYYKDKFEALLELVHSRLADDEILTEGFLLKTGKPTYSIGKKPLNIDPIKTGRELETEDWKILESHGFTSKALDGVNLISGYADRDDDIFIIRTSDASWKSLAGREWHYNLKTKEFKLVKMN